MLTVLKLVTDSLNYISLWRNPFQKGHPWLHQYKKGLWK